MRSGLKTTWRACCWGRRRVRRLLIPHSSEFEARRIFPPFLGQPVGLGPRGSSPTTATTSRGTSSATASPTSGTGNADRGPLPNAIHADQKEEVPIDVR